MWLASLQKYFSSTLYGDLQQSSRIGDFKQIKKLLDLGENPDAIEQDSDCTALYLSVLYSHMDCAILLLENNANPNRNVTIGEENTPLHIAAQGRKIGFIRLLLFFGADRKKENKYAQQTTHVAVAEREIGDFIEKIYQQVEDLKNFIFLGGKCFSEKNYNSAIKHYECAAMIYEKQIKDELQGIDDALYQSRKKPDNKPLVDYFYRKTLECYESAETAYSILMQEGALEIQAQKENYLTLLEKIVELRQKLKYPQESYSGTMAVLMMDKQKAHPPEYDKNILSKNSSNQPYFCLPTISCPQNPAQGTINNDEKTPLLVKKNV